MDKGTSLRDLIVGIIPNDMVTPFHTNNVLQMLFLACLFGVLLARAGSWAAWAREGMNFFTRFLMEAMGLIMLKKQ
jgi:Na+/H+-dicarboxylate symporter